MGNENVNEPCKGDTSLRKKGLIADPYLPLDLVMIRSELTTSYALSASKPSRHYHPFDMLSYHQPN